MICVYRRTLLIWLLVAIMPVALMGGSLSYYYKVQSENLMKKNKAAQEKELNRELLPMQWSPAKQALEKELYEDKSVSQITWAPNGISAVYVRKTGAVSKICIKKAGESKERVLGDYSSNTQGMFWSPNNSYVLLSEKSGEGTTSKIIRTDTLAVQTPAISSTLLPVWSPDGNRLAAANLEKDKNNNIITIRMYTVGSKDSRVLLKSPFAFGLYFVEYWDHDGIIGYSEVDQNGQRVKKTLAAPQR